MKINSGQRVAVGYGGLLVAFGVSFYLTRKYIVERRRMPRQGLDGPLSRTKTQSQEMAPPKKEGNEPKTDSIHRSFPNNCLPAERHLIYDFPII